MESADLSKTIDAVWKIKSPRLIAALARMTCDVGLAEDLAQDALVSALSRRHARRRGLARTGSRCC